MKITENGNQTLINSGATTVTKAENSNTYIVAVAASTSIYAYPTYARALASAKQLAESISKAMEDASEAYINAADLSVDHSDTCDHYMTQALVNHTEQEAEGMKISTQGQIIAITSDSIDYKVEIKMLDTTPVYYLLGIGYFDFEDAIQHIQQLNAEVLAKSIDAEELNALGEKYTTDDYGNVKALIDDAVNPELSQIESEPSTDYTAPDYVPHFLRS